jgi:predicted DNA-binding transcriptional regulator AlpA
MAEPSPASQGDAARCAAASLAADTKPPSDPDIALDPVKRRPSRTVHYDLTDACSYCGLQKTALYRLMSEGHFPPPRLRVSSKIVRWHIDDLDAWNEGKTYWPSTTGESTEP